MNQRIPENFQPDFYNDNININPAPAFFGPTQDTDFKVVETKPRKNRRRRKIDVQSDICDRAIPEIWKEFPKMIPQLKGKGHELHDIRLFLQWYQEWAFNLFPSTPFSEFIAKVEEFGGNRKVKDKIMQYRSGAFRLGNEMTISDLTNSSISHHDTSKVTQDTMNDESMNAFQEYDDIEKELLAYNESDINLGTNNSNTVNIITEEQRLQIKKKREENNSHL